MGEMELKWEESPRPCPIKGESPPVSKITSALHYISGFLIPEVSFREVGAVPNPQPWGGRRERFRPRAIPEAIRANTRMQY